MAIDNQLNIQQIQLSFNQLLVIQTNQKNEFNFHDNIFQIDAQRIFRSISKFYYLSQNIILSPKK